MRWFVAGRLLVHHVIILLHFVLLLKQILLSVTPALLLMPSRLDGVKVWVSLNELAAVMVASLRSVQILDRPCGHQLCNFSVGAFQFRSLTQIR